ncbi:MAG: arsenate reductase (glutaredoxin) [Pseudomonadota bacterium]
MASSKITLMHNPRCSKSRGALALLEDAGATPEIIHYLDSPPDIETLRDILTRLEMSARELMRTGEAVYKAKGLDDPALSEEQLLQTMIENPILIERPIAFTNDQAVVGRPPDRVLELI